MRLCNAPQISPQIERQQKTLAAPIDLEPPFVLIFHELIQGLPRPGSVIQKAKMTIQISVFDNDVSAKGYKIAVDFQFLVYILLTVIEVKEDKNRSFGPSQRLPNLRNCTRIPANALHRGDFVDGRIYVPFRI